MLENHYLDNLFNPRNIAIIGASDRQESVGFKVLSNLLRNEFNGGVYPVNPKHTILLDKPCYPSIAAITDKIDLAIITTPAETVPTVIKECGERGVSSAIIISAGFSESGEKGKQLEQTVLEIAHRYHLHFIGPNCLGVMRPQSHLNATFDNNEALPGQIALLSQSGAVCAAILDWALPRNIGFSTIVSMGNSTDLDFGDILEYLALDPATKSILLYIEGIRFPRRFMTGLRAASRVKPVIAIKAGRHTEGVRAVHSHTGALIGDDDIFSAALNRGGALRVMSIEDLFIAAELLSSPYRTKGNRLSIVTNGGGAGVMASDRAADLNIALPKLPDNLLAKLNTLLPAEWSHQNPIDILGDATPTRYREVLEATLSDEMSDALLAILVPVAMSKPDEVASEVCAFAKKNTKPIIACWMGDKQVEHARKIFAEQKVPVYSTPEAAVDAFSYLVNHHAHQQMLLQVPPLLQAQTNPDIAGAELIINAALTEGRTILTLLESKAILRAFNIPVSQTIEARTANDALIAAESLGFPVALKISSPDITHKQDVEGVQLNIQNGEAVRSAFNKMLEKVKNYQPNAKINGVTVERMYKNPNYRELMIGVIRDKVFGSIISFGMGGSLVEVVKDKAVALPPLNAYLAEQLIASTKASLLLNAFRGKPAVNKAALIDVLLNVSNMICELPEIKEMDINPLLIDENGAIAVDARIVIEYLPLKTEAYSHIAIHPYPHRLISNWQTAEGVTITIRPIRPEDASKEQTFIAALSPAAKYFRFMHEVKELTPEMLIRFTQIDYETEMAFVATHEKNQEEDIIGIARYFTQADKSVAEFAIVMADDWQRKGIGSRLMLALMTFAKAKGIRVMKGRILAENSAMLHLVQTLGFQLKAADEPTLRIASKELI